MATNPTSGLSHAQQLIAKARAAHAQRLELAASNSVASASNSASANSVAGNTAALITGDQSIRARQTALIANRSRTELFSPELNILTQAMATATAAQPVAATQSVQNNEVAQQTAISLNKEQAQAVEMGLRGHSFALIGAAGTGKTTTTQELIKLIQRASHMLPLRDSTKHLSKDSPGLVICGYTNKAVNNIRKKLPSYLQAHCITIHKLLEYAPTYFSVFDEEGNEKNTMRFEPSRNGANPLPHISTIIFEESSMIGTDLFGQVLDALPRPAATQFIFLGDIFQLPPVFGPSILGFKMSELPVIELTHVYRQALLSPIISLATAIRTDRFTDWLAGCAAEGNVNSDIINPRPAKLTSKVIIDSAAHGKVTIHPWKKRIAAPSALKTVVTLICNLIESNEYNPEEDQILCPFNKAMGTIELNKGIANYLTIKRGGITHEVIARFTRSYWSVDDRVLVDRHDGVIIKIEPTIGYAGKPTREASLTLNRDGFDSIADVGKNMQRSAEDILNELDAIAEADKEDDAKNLASHSITVWIADLGEERKLTTAGEINSLLLSYALTVHKSQGSEWRRVFLFLHSSHQTMCSRELLYTAITRAREELYIICEGDIAPHKNQLLTGSNRAVIPGTTLKEKIEYFAGKSASMKRLDLTS